MQNNSKINFQRSSLNESIKVFTWFVTPRLIKPKLMIQELWQRNIECDQTLPGDLEDRANKWINSGKYFSEIEISRYYGINMSIKKPGLNIFADSSSKTCVCAAYFSSKSLKTKKQKFRLSLVKVDKRHLKKNVCQSQNYCY